MVRVYRTRQFSILSLLVIIGICQVIFAQTSTSLYELYRDNNILKLKEIASENKQLSAEWKSFIEALFDTDAETSVQKLMAIYPKTDDANLQGLIRERISQYYSARGYYETSRRIMQEDAFFHQVISVKKSKLSPQAADQNKNSNSKIGEGGTVYGVQVGAFSSYENAVKSRRKYEQYYSNTTILEKNDNNRDLYIVLIGGYDSREAAEAAEEKINQQFNINGYIIQY